MPVDRVSMQVQQRGNLPIGHALSVEGCNRLFLGHADLVRHRRLRRGKTSAYDLQTLLSHWPVMGRPSLVLFQAPNDMPCGKDHRTGALLHQQSTAGGGDIRARLAVIGELRTAITASSM